MSVFALLQQLLAEYMNDPAFDKGEAQDELTTSASITVLPPSHVA